MLKVFSNQSNLNIININNNDQKDNFGISSLSKNHFSEEKMFNQEMMGKQMFDIKEKQIKL